MVGNIVRGDLPLDTLGFMSDEDFLALVKKYSLNGQFRH
jgi:hypothetical protein